MSSRERSRIPRRTLGPVINVGGWGRTPRPSIKINYYNPSVCGTRVQIKGPQTLRSQYRLPRVMVGGITYKTDTREFDVCIINNSSPLYTVSVEEDGPRKGGNRRLSLG